MRQADRSRRDFIAGMLAAPLTLATAGGARAAGGGPAALPAAVEVEEFSAAGKSQGRKTVARIVRSDEEWRRQLSAESFAVTRQAATERPYSGEYNAHHADGLYRCICCDTALFDSRTKFESGTGWPSFWKPISNTNVRESADHSLLVERTEVSCRRCDAHLGHVFDDGPDPTGLRYCMNSVSLKFVARA